MAMALDRRTRRDADLRTIAPSEFFADLLPDLVERHGAMVAVGIERLAVRPLAIEVGDWAWSFTTAGGTVAATDGIVAGALVVTLTDEQFSDWVQQQRTFNAFAVAQELVHRGGDERDVSIWDSLWLTMLEGWPIVDDGITFVDRHGDGLDLERIFTPTDDPADVAHHLREAGFLHLRGYVDPADMAVVASDMDRAVPHYTEGDGRSWWAAMDDGSHRVVRMQEFLGHSPTTEKVLRSDRWTELRLTLMADEELVQAPVTGRCIEALIKPVGVVAGPSDVTFHRDCHFGRHAYGCSGTVVGVSVTGSSEENGLLQVVAGSHRVAIPIAVASTEPYLPVVSVPTEPGDLTVHLGCTLHQSLPPKIAPRKVMYGCGFSLAPRPGDGDGGAGGRANSELREKVFEILLEGESEAVS